MTEPLTQHHDVKYELVAEASPEPVSEPPLRLVRRVLRGRWILLVVLVVLLATIGGLLGHHAVPASYASTGLIRIDGTLPAILTRNPENQAPPMFDAYVATQVTLLKSREVLDRAASRPEMIEAGWPDGLHGVARLQNALTVRRGKREQIIAVSVTDQDPKLAQTAVNAVLAAFEEVYAEADGMSLEAKREALALHEEQIDAELKSVQQRMLQESDEYGAQALSRIHADKVEQMLRVDGRIADLDLARTKIEMGDVSGVLELDSRGVSTGVADLEQQKSEIIAEIESLSRKYGPRHPMMRELNRKLDVVHAQLQLRQGLANVGNGDDDHTAPPTLVQASLDRLEQLRDRYQALRETMRSQIARMSRQLAELSRLRVLESDAMDRLTRTRQRLDELQVEAARGDMNRVTITAWGDKPVAPVGDRRRSLTAAGICFGALAGGAIVFFTGFIDRRARFVDELAALEPEAMILGLLPDLNSRDDHAAPFANRSIHQIRNLLELQCDDPNQNVHAVTSCTRGEGRTSIVLGMGASLAAAGRRTLLIDADLDAGTLSDEMGLVHVPGLCDAIGPEGASAQVHRTRYENLWALPIGAARRVDPQLLARDKLTWLLDALRDRFDAIIIDSGPLLTSVEACLVCAAADRVVTVVERNQRIDRVRQTLNRLHQIGATCAGVVFNRADPSDWAIVDEVGEKLSTHRTVDLVPRSRPIKRSVDADSVAPLGRFLSQPSVQNADESEQRKRAA